jgi:Diacylglycerol acyltransferase
LSKLGRKYRIGMTMFFGQLGLPIPFAPRMTLCFADALPVQKWTGEGPVPEEMVDALHSEYIMSLQTLFDKFKAAAGYPDAHLEIR